MARNALSVPQLESQLRTLGLEPGGVLLVHTSFRTVRPVAGGPEGVIAALRGALGPGGTLVMPSMTDDDDVPFDLATTPCIGMGIVADTFWRLPCVLRSDSPHAFAAIGPHAAAITATHPVEVPHGLDSPVGRVYELDGQVLLLGAGHDANTTIHLGESLAGVRYRRPKHEFVMIDGATTRIDYDEIDHCCQNFAFVGDWLTDGGLQRTGTVGAGTVMLARSRDIVSVVTDHLQADELMFLHPYGVDNECDEARASIPA